MTFYEEFKKDYDSMRQGPPPEPTPPSSPYQDTEVDHDAYTERYPAPPPPWQPAPPPQPPVAGGNGGRGGDDHRRRNWGLIGGAIIIVVIVISTILFVHPAGTTPLAETPTPTTTTTPTALPLATATASAPTPPPSCPPAPTQTGSLANMAFFIIPGIPAGSVSYYRSSENGEANHIQTRILYVCSLGTPDQITQTYATALSGWSACGKQCYLTTFPYNKDSHKNPIMLTKTVQVQAAQASGGITNYQLALTLNAASTKASLTFATSANIGFVYSDDQDATWLGNGQFQAAPNTFATPASECTSANMTYAQLRPLDYSGRYTISAISHDPNQPTIGCLKTTNSGLVNFSAYYTTDNQQLILSYTVYVTGFV